jgi:hypothetical protein
MSFPSTDFPIYLLTGAIKSRHGMSGKTVARQPADLLPGQNFETDFGA